MPFQRMNCIMTDLELVAGFHSLVACVSLVIAWILIEVMIGGFLEFLLATLTGKWLKLHEVEKVLF